MVSGSKSNQESVRKISDVPGNRLNIKSMQFCIKGLDYLLFRYIFWIHYWYLASMYEFVFYQRIQFFISAAQSFIPRISLYPITAEHWRSHLLCKILIRNLVATAFIMFIQIFRFFKRNWVKGAFILNPSEQAIVRALFRLFSEFQFA